MDKAKIETIASVLSGKSAAQMKELLVELCRTIPDTYRHVLQWGQTAENGLNAQLALEHWRRAEKIIDEFNAYGGGPEDEEDECCDEIEGLCRLIPELSWDTRQEIMDGMLAQYRYGNSGFEDLLTDTCFELCKEREEWLYLAERLLERGGSWERKLVMSIYRTIGDDSAFLGLREKELHYGSDYFELVRYYEEQGDLEKALSYARKGLSQGDGRVDHLAQYLFNHYERNGDTEALEEIMRICEQTKKERGYVSNRLFEHYRGRGDYENAKKHALKEFEHSANSGLDKKYARIKEHMSEPDWLAVRDGLLGELKKRDMTGYLNICIEEGNKREAYDTIFEKNSDFGGYLLWGIDRDHFADRLKRDFPEEMGEYFARLALRNVESGAGPNRRNYRQAVSYYRKVKEIYVKIQKDGPRWERLLSDLKERYGKRKAFLEEMGALD